MKTSLEHLPLEKQDVIIDIVKAIEEKILPEKIILFGSYATGKWKEDEYLEEGRWFEYRSDYDILVITKAGDDRSEYEVEAIADSRTGFRDIVSVITHDIRYINDKLSKGQYFFSEIQREGILLYDAGNIQLAEKRTLTAIENKTIAQEDFNFWYEKSKISLDLAKYSLEKGYLNDAVFLLHQAAERTYNAVILVFRGYKPKTHNLKKLYRYTKHYSVKLAGIFPQHTKEENDLFIKLKKGYVEARYDKDYTISKEEIQKLIQRIMALQTVAEIVCNEKIASFEA
jgi:HEPN domain-containing protein/predicted nucleotidyltransferase